MNDKELLEKLNRLKEIKLDSGWKSRTREILFSQVSNSVDIIKVSEEKSKPMSFKRALAFVCHPAGAAAGIFALFAFSIIGAQAAKNIKPGNQFYAARILSEKAQIAITFDEEKKEKLNVKFASTRAKDITEVLSHTDLSKEENKKKAEKLADAFKNEINTVKSGLENLNRIKEEKVAASLTETSQEDVVASDDVDENISVGIGTVNKNDGEEKVYAVESGKDNEGLEIYSASDPEGINLAASGTEIGIDAADKENSLVLPVENLLPAATTSQSFGVKLDEAESSFIANDFAAAKEILEQVNILIDDIDNNINNKEDNQPGSIEDIEDVEAIASSTSILPDSDIASGTTEIE